MSQEVDHFKRVAGDVSRETIEKMLELESIFLKWARTINLVAASTLNDAWQRHFLDSAQLWRLRGETRCWLDLGSGSGFPALVLAVLGHGDSYRTILVESNAKKSSYLRQAITTLQLDADVLTQRVETLDPKLFVPVGTTVTARAFAPLDRIFDWTNGFNTGSSRALLHKGRGFQAEVDEARRRWRFDLVEHASLVDSESVILDITSVERL